MVDALLTKEDAEFIKETHSEITQNRTEPITIYHRKETGNDPFTGGSQVEEVAETVPATWKTLTSQSGGEGEVEYVNGVRMETDDVIINVEIDYGLSDVQKVVRDRNGVEYKIKARDKLGLGKLNRHFILLEKVK